MNIVLVIILDTGEVESLAGALHAHLWGHRAAKVLRTWLIALGEALDALIELVGLDRVSAVPWTGDFLILVVLTIEIHLLCQILVLLIRIRVDLIAQPLEVQAIDILGLLNDLTLVLAGQSLEDGGECLRSWHHLRPGLFGGVHIVGVCLVVLAVVVDQRRAEADIALLGSRCLAIIVEIAFSVDGLVIVDFLDELELDPGPLMRVFWVLRPILVVAIVSFDLRIVLNFLDLSLTAVSGAGALSHLAAQTVRGITVEVRWSLRGDDMSILC